VNRAKEILRAFPFAPAAGLALLGTALAVVLRSGQAPTATPVLYDPSAVAAPEPHPGFVSKSIGALPGSSVHHVTTTTGVGLHLHRTHDETVVILSGKGRMRVGEETREISPGLTLVIPRGTPHQLEVLQGTVEAVSIFTPPFDGKDRQFLGPTAISRNR
jgi:mannose-6-phosphate isomerase-like protein (cupin superfamily)